MDLETKKALLSEFASAHNIYGVAFDTQRHRQLTVKEADCYYALEALKEFCQEQLLGEEEWTDDLQAKFEGLKKAKENTSISMMVERAINPPQ